jgi:imidazolonepropionase
MTIEADLLVHNASQLATLARPGGRAHRGAEMQDLAIVEAGAVAVAGGRIAAVGKLDEVRAAVKVGPRTRLLDAGGRLVTPGLVDAHTHLVFAGSREDEFVQKVVDGLSYQAIEQRGGGIPRTVAATRRAGTEELLRQARPVLARMFANGATTVEAKSGYALDTPGEIRLLEAVKHLDREGPVELVATFFGTHDVPPEHQASRERYLEMVIGEMLPAVADRRLALFVDSGTAYPPDQTAALYRAARARGLGIKVHADEFRPVGGAETAAAWSAVSAEHCICSTDEGIEAMARAGVIAVLLPCVPLVHRLDHAADARRFIGRGMAVALGTDFNPSCLVESMQLVLALGCYASRMSPAEALTAATVNAAFAVGRGDRVGSIEPGKQADIVIWEAANPAQLAERLGGNLVAACIKAGRVHGWARAVREQQGEGARNG